MKPPDIMMLPSEGEPPFSPEEARALKAALWSLLAKRVQYATLGDSGSIRVERAEELYESVCEALRAHLRRRHLPARTLLMRDLSELYDEAMVTTEEMLNEARALYECACEYPPPVGNLSYGSTLRELGGFFARYDYRMLWQDVPCDIDYQLCLPVPETLRGVSFVAEYLRRFLVEAQTSARFDQPSVKRLLCRAYGDPVELLVNLYEPVVANAVGAALCGLPVSSLGVPAPASRALAAALAGLSPEQIKQKLAQASKDALDELKIDDRAMRLYFGAACDQLAPRLAAALPDLRRVFVSLYD